MVLARYVSTAGQGKKRWFEVRRLLERVAVPAFGKRQIAGITRADVVELLDAQPSRSTPRALFAALRPLFKWCLDRGIIENNPIAGMRGPPPPRSRDRVLDAAEIRAFWIGTEALGWPFGPLLRLLLLTGQRREEVASLHWHELDIDSGLWTIPAERTKNGVEHLVDLSPQACAVIANLPGERRGLVFSTTGNTPVSGFSKIKARLDSFIATELGLDTTGSAGGGEGGRRLKPWRFHDLRRTMATMMGEELEIDPGVIERILNHISGSQGGLQGTYQRQKHRAKRRAALLAWGAFVERLVVEDAGGGNVAAMANRR